MEVFPLKIEAEMNLYVRQLSTGQGDTSDTGKMAAIIPFAYKYEKRLNTRRQ